MTSEDDLIDLLVGTKLRDDEIPILLNVFRDLIAENDRLREEVQTWVNHTKTAVWSDSEYCETLERINEALLAAPTVDVDVVVPARDYSTMTPKDCYEAGLLDGVHQAREAIKAAARAALEGKHG